MATRQRITNKSISGSTELTAQIRWVIGLIHNSKFCSSITLLPIKKKIKSLNIHKAVETHSLKKVKMPLRWNQITSALFVMTRTSSSPYTECVIEQKKASEDLHLLWKPWDTHLIPFTVISWSSQPVTAQGRLLPTWPSEHTAEFQAFWSQNCLFQLRLQQPKPVPDSPCVSDSKCKFPHSPLKKSARKPLRCSLTKQVPHSDLVSK